QARVMVEAAQERGYLDPAELEAFAVELDLNDEEVEELTAELEKIGIEIVTPAAAAAAAADAEREKEKELAAAEAAAAASGSADSLQLFLADVGRHKLLTAADEVDRKSTRLNSSHQIISYAVFCLKKKKLTVVLNHIS